MLGYDLSNWLGPNHTKSACPLGAPLKSEPCLQVGAPSGTKSEWGIVLTGYVVPGCVEDGTWMLWENSSAAVAVVLARFFLEEFSKQVVIFNHFLWQMTFRGMFYLEGRFLCQILELCRTRRKRLYILQEINPRWLQTKKCFHEKTGVEIKHMR